jgi:integrase/recombinase XerD
MKLTQAIQGYKIDRLSSGYSSETMKGYDYAFKKLVEYLRDPELDTITTEQLRQFFWTLRTESALASASHKAIWRAIRSFYNWASKEFNLQRPDNIPAPPCQSKTITPFTEDEIKRLLRACDQTRPSAGRRAAFQMSRPSVLRDKAIILFLLDTGLRASECTRLTLGDINLETGQVIVRPFGSGRKSRGRMVYMGKSTRRVIWRYLTERDNTNPDQPLFLSRDGLPMNRDSLAGLLQSLGKRAGIRNVHPHRFRHTFAIQYLRNGGDVFTLQRLLGHSSLEMVRNYLALADTDNESAHRRASPADNWKL